MVVAGREAIGTFDSFSAEFGSGSLSENSSHAFSARITPYLLRRTKDECLDLPERLYTDVIIDLPAWQRRLYDRMRDDLVCETQSLSGEQFKAFAPTALTRLLRLSQLASNPDLVFPGTGRTPGKFFELDRIIEEILFSREAKVILWSYYVGTIERLLDRYAEFGAVAIYGAVPSGERQTVAAAFQNDPAVRILIANPAAAGTGFTLTAAAYAIYETLSWRYDHYAQSQDRNHRIGQKNPVTYLRLLAADTVEQVIAEALARKSSRARSLLGDPGTDHLISSLSREEFCRMLIENRLP
jgi:SNF2 family DNA or RNA helicase